MLTLLSEKYAPITSSIGYLRLSLTDAASALTHWRSSIVSGEITSEPVDTGFPECLHALEPLTGGVRPRELLVEMSGDWTAYFDCGLAGPDPISTIGHLAQAIPCQGLAIDVSPHTFGVPGVERGRYGGVQFQMFGPLQTEFLNYVRTISVANDGGRWVFTLAGTEQWFEETQQYRSRRIRDRFNSRMLERYCLALDLDVFNPAVYGPRAVLVSGGMLSARGGKVMSLKEVQQWLGIVPGMADKLSG